MKIEISLLIFWLGWIALVIYSNYTEYYVSDGEEEEGGKEEEEEGEWDIGRWGQCTKKCDGGRQHRSVVCRDARTNRVLGGRACPGRKPEDERRCNTQACSTSQDTEISANVAGVASVTSASSTPSSAAR